MRRTLCLLPFLLAAPVYCAEQTALVDLLPADAQIAFGIKVHSVLNSELAKNLTAEMKGQTAEWQKLIALSGFDPLNDLDEVLIASTGAGEKAPTLIVARGKFDVAKLAANAEIYNGVPLVTSQNPKAPGVYGFLDETTAIAGDPDTVRAAIDHRGQAASLDAKLASQISEYRDRYDIWAVVNRPEGLAKFVPKSNGPAASGLDSIDHFQFGLSVQKGLELAAEVHARTAKDAEQLSSTLQFLDAMTKASQPSGSQGTKFAFAKGDDGTLKVTLAVSEEEIKKQIETQRRAGIKWSLAPAQPQATTASATPPPAVAPPAPAIAAPSRTVLAQPVLPSVAQEQAPARVQAPPKPVAPGVGPDDGRTAVFTLPTRPQ
jgi:hypothetical protein